MGGDRVHAKITRGISSSSSKKDFGDGDAVYNKQRVVVAHSG